MASRSVSRATIEDVAALAKVSIATVSRVLNNTGPVSIDTTQRVMDAISRLNYVPRAAARALASNRTETLGLLLPALGSEFFPPLLRGVEHAARHAGFDLLIHTTGARGIQHGKLRRAMGEQNTDGLLIFTGSVDDQDLHRFYEIRFPVVLLLQSPPLGVDLPSVNFENKSGARQLMEHLITVHGYRRIAFLRGPAGNQDSEWRERGYCDALEAHGIEVRPELIAVGNFEVEDSRAIVAAWIEQGLEIDAIFAGDDDSAIGAFRALQLAGKRIPEDIAIVGFDDVQIARYLSPPLTTVHAPIEDAGRIGAELLISQIQTGHAGSELLPTEMIIRGSCGCQV
jgi:LacI family transcriptional regulator